MAGETPASPSSFDRDPIERLADSLIARFRAGERPSVEEHALKYPELADEIRDLLPALVELELNNSPGNSETGDLGVAVAAGDGSTPRHLGDYLILREIGRGGMGVVYEALQQSLGRHVALKVLPSSSLAGTSHLERFRLEARSAARLHHTNIVPVFGVGEQDGVHYYAMQFIQGQGLDEVFEELRRLRAARSQAPAPPEPSGPDPARARTLAATQGLLTGRFAAGAEDAGPGGDPTAADDPDGGSMTEAGTAEPAPASSHAGKPEGPGISGHSELSGTQAEGQYYRSVARVGLQVAEALAYAHSQGIVHRDIKPSNLLLDARGTTWVTDFGLAKAEGVDALTDTGDIVGTLRYMAPERFDGWSDPRSDVYSLGATLYELLTLRHLFPEPNRAKLIDRVLHDAPTPPRKLDRKVPRDLETIVLKAIAKEPADRYGSAEQMAEDLRRFLADRPVLARRSSPAEQAWRWCRRNKGLAAGTAAAVLGLVAAVVALAIANIRISWSSRELASAVAERGRALDAARTSEAEANGQRARAEAGEAQARAAVDQFLNRVTEDALLKAPGLQAMRRDLLRSALRFYDEFLLRRRDDPGLRAALADVHLRVGRIHGDLGDADEARASYLAARAIYRELARADPADRDARAGLADSQRALGEFSEAIAISEELVRLDPANRRYRRGLAIAYQSLALGLEPGRMAEILEADRKALALHEALVRESPDDPEARSNLAGILNNLGVVLARQGHLQDALTMYRRAVEHSEFASARAPQVFGYGLFLGNSYGNTAGMLQALGQADEAIPAYRKAVEHWRRLARENPGVPAIRVRLSAAASQLAYLLRDKGRKAEADELWRLVAELMEGRPSMSGLDWYNLACYRALVAAAIDEAPGTPGDADRRERGRLIASAMDALRRSVEIGGVAAPHMRADPDLAILRDRPDFRALVNRQQAADDAAALAARAATSPPEERLRLGREVVAARARLVAEEPGSRVRRADLAASRYAFGQVLVDLEHLGEAEEALGEALAAREALAREEPANLRHRLDVHRTRLALGRLHCKAMRLDRADREWTAALRGLEDALRDESADSPARAELDDARIEVAGLLLDLGLWEEAGEHLDRVFRRGPSGLARDIGHYWHIHALLRLLAGDADGYRASCTAFFRHFAPIDNKFNLYRAAFAGPGALGPEELTSLVASAEKDLGRYARDNWYLLFLGMGLARAGRFEEALEVLDRSRPEYRPAIPDHGLRAIVLHRLGRADEARQALDEADRELAQVYRDALSAAGPILIPLPFEVVLREAFRRDARAMIDGRPPGDDPDRRLLRDRVLERMGRGPRAGTAPPEAR